MKTLLLSLLCLAACYAPDLSKVHYTCDEKNPFCPDGQSCIAGCCGGPPCGDEPAPGRDGGAGDGSAPDGGNADLVSPSWDPAAPPANIPACKSGRKGWQLTTKMAACQAGSLLPDGICNDLQGWTPCQANQLTQQQCSSVPWGFFGSRQHGRQDSRTPDGTMQCTWNGGAGATSTEQRFIFGCGKAGAVVTWDITENPCGGFQRAIPCHGGTFSAPSSWSCPYGTNTDQDAGQVAADPMDGELCCHA